MLRQSLIDMGAGRSALIDDGGNIIAGNKTVEAARALGIPIQVIDSDGKSLVVVRRTDLDLYSEADDTARLLAYFDNRSNEVGLSWNATQMAADMERDLDLAPLWTDGELSRFTEQSEGQAVAEEFADQFEQEVADLDGMQDANITIVVPAKYEQEIRTWLAHGERETGAGLGRGVMIQCGLL